MNLFTLTINDKEYDVINSLELNNKKYIIYKDNINTYVNEYIIDNNNIKLLEIDDKTLKIIEKVVNK